MKRALPPRASALPLVLLGALLGGASTCEQCSPIPDPRRGNVDRVADAVLVTGRDDHTFLVTSNPEIQHLRVLDLTDERFADGPNRFFPLSVPVGPETRRLAVPPDDEDFVFALDAAADRIFMVRTPAAAGEPWLTVGGPIPTANAPADLAAHKLADLFVLSVTLPDVRAVERIVVDKRGTVQSDAIVSLPTAISPAEIVVDPTSDALLVTDAVANVVHVLRAADGSFERDLDVGGPQGPIAVGQVDVGDGLAPVALIGRRDAEQVWALRLYRPGYREARYAVLGGTFVDGFPLATYVNDVTDDVTVCCRGLSGDSVSRGEATSAFGAVALGSGRVLYLALAADHDGTRLVRLVDDDPAGLGYDESFEVDPISGTDGLFQPGPGPDGAARRPDRPTFTRRIDFGDPPFFETVEQGEVLSLTWEGALPSLRNRRAEFASGLVTAESGDFESRGARVGDRAEFSLESPDAGCETRDLGARILAVAGTTFTVALGAGSDAIDGGDALCLESSGDVRVSVLVANAFSVQDDVGRFFGRLALTPRDGDPPAVEGTLPLPGADMAIRESAAGPPTRGSRLFVPLNPHVDVMGLALSDAVGRLGEGGFGSAGFLVQTMVGRSMRFPDPSEDGAMLKARRLIITTGSADNSGLNVVFSCDDAETTAGLCDAYR